MFQLRGRSKMTPSIYGKIESTFESKIETWWLHSRSTPPVNLEELSDSLDFDEPGLKDVANEQEESGILRRRPPPVRLIYPGYLLVQKAIWSHRIAYMRWQKYSTLLSFLRPRSTAFHRYWSRKTERLTILFCHLQWMHEFPKYATITSGVCSQSHD